MELAEDTEHLAAPEARLSDDVACGLVSPPEGPEHLLVSSSQNLP